MTERNAELRELISRWREEADGTDTTLYGNAEYTTLHKCANELSELIDEMTEFTLESELIEGECDIHDCTDDSEHLWFGVTIEDDGMVLSFPAEYCPDHSQSHAETKDGFQYIGEIHE